MFFYLCTRHEVRQDVRQDVGSSQLCVREEVGCGSMVRLERLKHRKWILMDREKNNIFDGYVLSCSVGGSKHVDLWFNFFGHVTACI